MATPKKQLTAKQLEAKKKATAAKAATTRKTTKYTKMREDFAQQNPEKSRDIYDIVATHLASNPQLHPNLPAHMKTAEYLRANSDPKTLYEFMGYKGADADRTTHLGQPHLPGLEPEGLLDTPKRWEDFSDEQRSRVLSSAAKFGVTIESAHAALAATLDRANQREGGKHSSFYTTMGKSAEEDTTTGENADMPRQRLVNSAAENEVPFHVQAVANAITSPKNNFVRKPASGPRAGQVVYPNDAAATEAINWAKKEDKTGKDYLKEGFIETPEGKKKRAVTGFPANTAKAVNTVKGILEGKTVQEAWNPKGGGEFGNPKVGPFHDAWIDPMGPSQYWVSDVHSGAPAFAPHLKDEKVGKKVVKNDATRYMNIPGIHAFHDWVARNVMQSRGLTSVTGTQSQHWSQEKFEKGHKDIAQLSPAPEAVSQQFKGMFDHGNQELGGVDWAKYGDQSH